MSCYNPLKAFRVLDDVFVKDSDGNLVRDPVTDLFITKRDWTVKVRNNKVVALTRNDFHPIYDPALIHPDDFTNFDYVPCRKCFGCREDSAKMWTDRLMIELQDHDESWFITLTYSDYFLPYSQEPNEDGVLPDRPTLRKKDFQDFMKRLRKACSNDHLMYYAAGEYGDSSKRPHYHAIIFSLHLDDLKEWKRRGEFVYYTSEFLENIWPFGFVAVAKVNRETAAYTCRYVMKKAIGDEKQVYYDLGIEPEFQLMSKRPAIGRNYYDRVISGKQEDYYVNKIHYLTDPDGSPISFNIPRYFDSLTEKENPDILVSIKEKRKKIGRARQKLLEAHSSKRYEDILSDIESVKIAKNINFRNSSKGGFNL